MSHPYTAARLLLCSVQGSRPPHKHFLFVETQPNRTHQTVSSVPLCNTGESCWASHNCMSIGVPSVPCLCGTSEQQGGAALCCMGHVSLAARADNCQTAVTSLPAQAVPRSAPTQQKLMPSRRARQGTHPANTMHLRACANPSAKEGRRAPISEKIVSFARCDTPRHVAL